MFIVKSNINETQQASFKLQYPSSLIVKMNNLFYSHNIPARGKCFAHPMVILLFICWLCKKKPHTSKLWLEVRMKTIMM